MVEEEPICSREKEEEDNKNPSVEDSAGTSSSENQTDDKNIPDSSKNDDKDQSDAKNLEQIKEMVAAAKEKGLLLFLEKLLEV